MQGGCEGLGGHRADYGLREVARMEEKRQFPTPAMLEARERWANMSPEEREARRKQMREEIRKQAERGFSLKMQLALRDEVFVVKTANHAMMEQNEEI